MNSQAQAVRLAKILKVQNIIKSQIIELSSWTLKHLDLFVKHNLMDLCKSFNLFFDNSKIYFNIFW